MKISDYPEQSKAKRAGEDVTWCVDTDKCFPVPVLEGSGVSKGYKRFIHTSKTALHCISNGQDRKCDNTALRVIRITRKLS